MSCQACERARRLLPRQLAERLRALELRRLEKKAAKRGTKALIDATNRAKYATNARIGETEAA